MRDHRSGARPVVPLWDADGEPLRGESVVVLWRAFRLAGGGDWHSIPAIVEKRADELKSRYLAWVHELGEAHVDRVRLLDLLTLRPGLSYWWMTLPTALSYGESSPVSSAIRTLALADLLRDLNATKVIIATADETLFRTVSTWCKSVGMEAERQRVAEAQHRARPGLRTRVYTALPQVLQALIYLVVYVVQRWPLRSVPERTYPLGAVTLVDYLMNLDVACVDRGRYASYYWTTLVALLEASRIPVNWLHVYLRHGAVPNAQEAKRLLMRLNEISATGHAHLTLEAAVGLQVAARALHDYMHIALKSRWMGKSRAYFVERRSGVDLWPLFQAQCNQWMRGKDAMTNCLLLNLAEFATRALPTQKLGIYLFENIAWELGFIYAWKAAGHGTLIGVQHASVMYWDLRYFFDPRSYETNGTNDLPLPDLLAVNSQSALELLRNAGFPEERIVKVEALRYLYLAQYDKSLGDSTVADRHGKRVLVLGEFQPELTAQQLRWLTAAAAALPDSTQFIMKAHPNCPVMAGDYADLRLQITDAPLSSLLGDCDIVFTGNRSSAAVDAYSAGLPVVSIVDAATFNLSPLRGLPGVTYVSDARELAEALLHPTAEPHRARAYFCVDERLPRWRDLFSRVNLNNLALPHESQNEGG